MNRTIFKYNMSIYYQSTIVYMVVFFLYLIIRGALIENEYHLSKDPITYFFGLILIIAIISLLYNLYRNRHLEISESGIKFISRSRTREIEFADIKNIRLFKERRSGRNTPFRIIALFLKQRRRPVILNPNNYENQFELIKVLRDIKTKKNL